VKVTVIVIDAIISIGMSGGKAAGSGMAISKVPRYSMGIQPSRVAEAACEMDRFPFNDYLVCTSINEWSHVVHDYC
jgi:hypothetical protein